MALAAEEFLDGVATVGGFEPGGDGCEVGGVEGGVDAVEMDGEVASEMQNC